MTDIDNILNDIFNENTEENNTSPETPPSQSSEEPQYHISDEDLTDILEENGYSEEASSDTEESQEMELEELEEDFEEEDPLENNNIEDSSEENSLPGEEADIPESLDIEDTIDEDTVEEESSLIPFNSPTLLIDETTTRFSGTEWYNEIQKSRIIVAGIGGIGSNVVFQLARMTPSNITIYDDDNVETVNMAGQLFSSNDIGKSKVAAITDMVTIYTNIKQVYAIKERFTMDSEAGDVMICGFDNMAARKVFFNSWLAHIKKKSPEEQKNCLFIDGRLSIDTLQVFCIQGNDYSNIIKYADEYLFSDYEADATVCSMKQTTYLACMIGSVIVNMFTNFIANTLDPIIPYDLPFFIEYDAQNIIFKTEH